MLTKICKQCGLDKPLSNFQIRTRKKQGISPQTARNTICRSCTKERRAAQGCCKRCGVKIVDGVRCDSCKELNRKHSIDQRLRRKTKVISHYGNRCVFCGESRILFLTIDHKHDDGAKHRKEIGGGRIYIWLVKNNYPDGFQVACFNCNCGKALVGEEELRKTLAIKYTGD